MRSVGRGLTAVGAGALLLAACAGPAEVPVIEAAEEAVEEADPAAPEPDEADAADGDGSSSADDTAATDAGEDAEGSEDPSGSDPGADDAGSGEAGDGTPVPDPDLVAAPCAAHEGREMEPFLDLVAPVDGQAAGQQLEIVGCSNVYEATVNWRLVDEAGGVLDQGFTTAECGTGCVGAFADTVPLTAAAGGSVVTLQVFWISPQDGADTDLQERTIALG